MAADSAEPGGRGQTAVTPDRTDRAGWTRPVPVLASYDALLRTGTER